ncbi:MAG: hypothetical protein FWF29_12150 [Treponema sp.]|nr:hypothetical protein [Treponema sp.]
MTIEQTVEITADRRIFLDLPPELPIGRVKVELTLTPLSAVPEDIKKIRLTKPMIDKLLNEKTLRTLTGLLHNEMTIDEIRTERLLKHDHTD